MQYQKRTDPYTGKAADACSAGGFLYFPERLKSARPRRKDRAFFAENIDAGDGFILY